VRGRVGITGSIPENEFQSAKLQFGAGMNPGSWIQIGSSITEPGDNIWLGTWDTTDIKDGVYALQLVLVKENQRIFKISKIVSVDNTAPEIIISTDLSGGISFSPGKELLIITEFENPSEIKQVDFFLNNDLVGSRTTAPYLIPWRMELGEHSLAIRAIDLAGNRAELELDFIVK
jgi:hypothetical protein